MSCKGEIRNEEFNDRDTCNATATFTTWASPPAALSTTSTGQEDDSSTNMHRHTYSLAISLVEWALLFDLGQLHVDLLADHSHGVSTCAMPECK